MKGNIRHMMMRWTAAVAIAVLTGISTAGQNTSSQESRKAALEKEIAILNKQLNENSRKSQTALANLTLLQKKVSTRRKLLSESELEIANITNRIRVKEDSLKRLQDRLDTMSLYYNRLVKNAYRNRDSKVWFLYILASQNMGQAYRRFGYLKNLSGNLNNQAVKLRETREEVEKQKEELEDIKSRAIALRAQRQSDLKTLQSEESDSQKLISTLKRDRKQYQNQLAQKRKQVEALNREIQRIIQEAMRKAETAGKGKTGGTSTAKKGSTTTTKKDEIDYTLAKSFESNKGRLPWPADGPVVEAYGQHPHPVYKTVMMPFNYGWTIALDPGTSVKAVFDGVVSQVIVQPGFNQCVLVQHGNYFTFYCKLTGVSVRAGDKVKTGQVLGKVDTIAGETQLHFQLWQGRTPQNPQSWLRR